MDLHKNPLLEVKDLYVSYGSLKILFDIDVHINKGEIVVMIGRNGAGKTTLFKTIAGFVKQDSGDIFYNGESIGKLKPYEIAILGVKYVPQDKQVFGDLTVKENLELGSYATKDYEWDKVFEHFPKLKTLINRKAGNLSGGEKQMLLIGMALLGSPRLILLDEPTEGLAPHIIDELTVSFRLIGKQTTLFIIEQNLPMTAEIADRVYSMQEGKIVAETVEKEHIKSLIFEKYL